jgi:outer membrane protein assembly factor BamB
MSHPKFPKLLFIVFISVVCVAQQAAMFRGGPTHTGVYDGTPPTTQAQVKWKFQTGARIIGSATVANGTVYFGSMDNSFYAVDAETGTQKWKVDLTDAVSSTPAVEGNAVYFTAYDGELYSLNSATGKANWEFKTDGERRYAARHIHGIDPDFETMTDFWDFYLSSPVVWQGAVYFGSGGGNIYAVDAMTGVQKWRFRTGSVVHSSPAIADGTLFVGSFDTYFYAIDAATGKEQWRHKTGEDPLIHNQEGITSSPAVVEGMVYFGCRNATIYALDAKTGAEVWTQVGKRGWVSVSPAVREGKVYVATGSDKVAKVLDAKTGAIVSSAPIDSGVFSSLALVDDTAYFGGFNDKLMAWDLKTNTLKSIFSTDGPTNEAERRALDKAQKFISPTFYDDRVAFMIRRMDAGIFVASPVIANNTIYIGSTNGYMYALK